jgi:hypothetical protein
MHSAYSPEYPGLAGHLFQRPQQDFRQGDTGHRHELNALRRTFTTNASVGSKARSAPVATRPSATLPT